MLKRGFLAIAIAGMTLAGAGMAHSTEVRNGDLPPAIAKTLDTVGAEFARHTREHRLMEVERNMDRQQYRDRRYGRGRGYDRGYDRGGRDYGYRRGYGAPRGYGYGGRMYNGQPVLRAD